MFKSDWPNVILPLPMQLRMGWASISSCADALDSDPFMASLIIHFLSYDSVEMSTVVAGYHAANTEDITDESRATFMTVLVASRLAALQ